MAIVCFFLSILVVYSVWKVAKRISFKRALIKALKESENYKAPIF